jgi:hypothetical protein
VPGAKKILKNFGAGETGMKRPGSNQNDEKRMLGRYL